MMATILFADDTPEIRALFCAVLRDAGYSVLQAEDGLQALSLACWHPGPIDLLITDIAMPRMDGIELRRALAQIHPETAALFISSLCGTTLDLSEPFLPKPFGPAALLSSVKELLAENLIIPAARQEANTAHDRRQ